MPNATVKVKFSPKPLFAKLLKRVKNRQPLNRKIATIEIALVNETHRRSGIPAWKRSLRVKKEGGRTGYKTGRMQRGWRPVPGKMAVSNSVYNGEFYLGRMAGTKYAPASYRRIRRSVKLGGQRRKKKQTVGITRVKAHRRRVPAMKARPIRWTKSYLRKAGKTIALYVAEGK